MRALLANRLLQHARTALFMSAMALAPLTSASTNWAVSVTIAPPAIPVYVQPVAPGPGYLWTPGYWVYGPDGYYWVPGTWVLPPYVGALWTPGYWVWTDGIYVWYAGYWGPRVGFYGGINYGFGYTGYGYYGGYWRGDDFHYNRTVNNVNTTVVHNTYVQTVNEVNGTRVSYNGGEGGTRVQASAADRAYMSQRHTAATSAQVRHERAASGRRELAASVNQGRPAIAATVQPVVFDSRRATQASAPKAEVAPANTGRSAKTQVAPPAATREAKVREAPQAARQPTAAPPERSSMRADAARAQAQPRAAMQGPPQGKPQGRGEGRPQGGKNASRDDGNGGKHGK
jgi:hypothetical protein